MLAAEFGYKYDYVDWCLDLDDIAVHLEYRKQCPPIGALFLTFMEALGGGKESQGKEKQASNSLEEFLSDFSGAGGQVK